MLANERARRRENYLRFLEALVAFFDFLAAFLTVFLATFRAFFAFAIICNVRVIFASATTLTSSLYVLQFERQCILRENRG